MPVGYNEYRALSYRETDRHVTGTSTNIKTIADTHKRESSTPPMRILPSTNAINAVNAVNAVNAINAVNAVNGGDRKVVCTIIILV